MTTEDIVRWIKIDLVPRLRKSVKTWEDFTVEECTVEPLEGMKDNWASSMYKLHLVFRDKQNKTYTFPTIVKIMVDSEQIRQSLQSERQFANEILTYSTVIPRYSSIARKTGVNVNLDAWFARCFFTHINEKNEAPGVEDFIIVMEDLKRSNFKLGHRTTLDLKHCFLAFDCLGKFHAFSYYLKHTDKQWFESVIVSKIHETNFSMNLEHECNMNHGVCVERVLEVIEQDSTRSENDVDLEKLKSMSREPFSYFRKLVQPKEPFAVLCHGDFLRNNIMFRYVEDEPTDIKLLDFQTIRYASPAIDLSLFLFMNTSQELRDAHLDELLSRYHNSLTTTLSQLLGSETYAKEIYNWDAFLQDFREHAMFGYLITVYFLPWMFAHEEELAELVRLWKYDIGSPAYKHILKTIGGPSITKLLVELTRELARRGFL